MAKVLIVNPVIREEDEPRHVPYGLALLAAIAMEKGHKVQVYDANAWRGGPELHARVFAADDWQVIALGGITTQYVSIKQLVKQAREICPTALIVIGGGVLTSLPREVMTWLPEVDIGGIGEGFVTFPEILEMYDQGLRDWSKILGTISRGEDGRLIMSDQRPLIHDLDSLPYPAWDLFPLEEVYFKHSEALYSEEGMMAKRRLDINASYGCSLICRFCYHLGIAGDMRYVTDENGETVPQFDSPGTYTRTVRYHSPEYVVRMARHMYDKYHVDFIAFLDENLMTMDKSSGRVWMKEICRLWEEYGLAPTYDTDADGNRIQKTGIHWSGTSHATQCTPEILKIMRQAGCAHLTYGYESFSTQILKRLGKGSSPQTNMLSFFWTLEAGIRPQPNQIIGFPSEDFDSIRESMSAWEKLGLVVKPFYATAYPGSEWFTTYRKQITEQYGGDLESYMLDLGDATRVTGVISHNFNGIELLGLREAMVKKDFRMINQYEQIWRRNHGIPDGAPSTLYKDPEPTSKAAE